MSRTGNLDHALREIDRCVEHYLQVADLAPYCFVPVRSRPGEPGSREYDLVVSGNSWGHLRPDNGGWLAEITEGQEAGAPAVGLRRAACCWDSSRKGAIEGAFAELRRRARIELVYASMFVAEFAKDFPDEQ